MCKTTHQLTKQKADVFCSFVKRFPASSKYPIYLLFVLLVKPKSITNYFFFFFPFLFDIAFLLLHPVLKMSAGIFTTPVAGFGSAGLKSGFPKPLVAAKDSVAWTRKTVSNGSKTHCMKVTSSYQVMFQTTFAVIKLIGLLSPGIWVAAFRFRIRECFHFSHVFIPRDFGSGCSQVSNLRVFSFLSVTYPAGFG